MPTGCYPGNSATRAVPAFFCFARWETAMTLSTVITGLIVLLLAFTAALAVADTLGF
jgi:hypothetical protein